MKFTFELEIGLSFLLQSALPRANLNGMQLRRTLGLAAMSSIVLVLGSIGFAAAGTRSDAAVPGSARVLKISWKHSSRKTIVVTNLNKVRRIAKIVDAMGPAGICSESGPPPGIIFQFLRSREGPRLAQVGGVYPPVPAAACYATYFSVRGHAQHMLVNDSGLLHKASRILGRRLY